MARKIAKKTAHKVEKLLKKTTKKATKKKTEAPLTKAQKKAKLDLLRRLADKAYPSSEHRLEEAVAQKDWWSEREQAIYDWPPQPEKSWWQRFVDWWQFS